MKAPIVDSNVHTALTDVEAAEQHALQAQQAAEQARAKANEARQRAEAQRLARQQAWAQATLRDAVSRKQEARAAITQARAAFDASVGQGLDAALAAFSQWQDANATSFAVELECYLASTMAPGASPTRDPAEPDALSFATELSRVLSTTGGQRQFSLLTAYTERREAIFSGEDPS